MMKQILIFAVVSLFIATCNQATDPDSAPPRPPTSVESSLAKASESFGLGLCRVVSASEPAKNQFISPLSVSLALGMTLNGASGETYDSIRTCLALQGLTEAEINGAYRTLMDLLRATDPAVAMEIANAAWYRDSFSLEPSFTDALTASYDARVSAIDFSSPQAAPTINAWVSDATHAKITEIVPSPIPPDVVLYLINAIYFKGTWTFRFDPAETRNRDFVLPDSSVLQVPTMHLKGKVRYAINDGVTVLDLGYGSGYFRMTFVMPTDGRSVDEFVSGLSDAGWKSLVNSVEEHEIDIYVPKFRMEYENRLNDDLRAMGMSIAFDPLKADFTRMNAGGGIVISNVMHKTFVQVDEEGTEAAAVTSVEFQVTSLPESVQLNRPFVFAIRDANTGTVIFFGKVVAPEW